MKNRIQTILDDSGAVFFPGVYDTLSAKIVERLGFPLTFVSGYAVAASTIGEPDMGLLTQMEMIDRARRICMTVGIPVIVDADTGYGNPLNVIRTVHELIAAGAAGCFLEDQLWPKKCGHMRGKKVVKRQEYIQKIRAACEARGDRDFFIVARTDALAAVSLDEAVARVTEAREAGADASFIEAPGSVDEMAEICRRAPGPNVANMIEGGRTPVLPPQQLRELGYQLIVHPLAGLYAAAAGMEAIYGKLKADQTTIGNEADLMVFEKFNKLIGVDEKYAQSERFGG
jgi:2-methylisocitrate lyase-like PEP mutase family enzyme